MFRLFSAICVAILLSGSGALAQSGVIEPDAGTWKTWVISSGSDFRVPPPPDAAATAAESEQVRDLIARTNVESAAKITFWDAGSPGYRWIEWVNNRFLWGQKLPPHPFRIYTYLTMAIYDATIAAWESKYFYNRKRPGELDPTLATAVATPGSPSYPSEHAAAAGAAATVLAYFFPDEASSLQAVADEAALSRVQAGVQFPSDSSAGLELGRKVGERVVELAKADGSDAVWTGTVPTGPCMWTGENPANVTLPSWKPILLTAANEFRPPAPPDCHSGAVKAQVE